MFKASDVSIHRGIDYYRSLWCSAISKTIKDNDKEGGISINAASESSVREMRALRIGEVGRVGSWATDFEKLLSDPVGLKTFTV